MVTVEQTKNGYILRLNHGAEVFKTTEELFNRLLLHFEGRAPNFGGVLYGRVEIHDRKEKTEEG